MINDNHFKAFPVLETPRLVLRQRALKDAKVLQYIRSHPKVMSYMDAHPHKTVEDSRNFIAEGLERYSAKKGIFWGLVDKASGEFIGDIAFWRIDKKNARAEVGYTLKPEFWGKGYMKEAMSRIIDFGFDQLQLHSIEANINPKNDNSRNLLLRMGFRKEAYFRENYFYNGDFLDSEIYSLLQSDWKNRQP